MNKQDALDRTVTICAPLGGVSGKAMFGGFGVFCDGLMFALITRAGDLYLKADDDNRSDFEAAGAEKYGNMAYYRAPAAALESWAAMEPWAEGALAAARRAAEKKKKGRRKGK